MAKASPPEAPEPAALSINDARAATGETLPPADDAVPIEPAPPAEPVEPAPVWGNWRYLGHRTDIVYTAVPVTPQPGDVVGWWGPPGHDGLWEPTDAEPTRMPDNHRPDITEEQAAKLRGDTTDNA